MGACYVPSVRLPGHLPFEQPKSYVGTYPGVGTYPVNSQKGYLNAYPGVGTYPGVGAYPRDYGIFSEEDSLKSLFFYSPHSMPYNGMGLM